MRPSNDDQRHRALLPAPVPARVPVDKSALPIGEPKRLRSPDHLRFVARQPCLVCGRQPTQAHHLRFAQPRALARKVSDEFTVPLCNFHHDEVHKTGNEFQWWRARGIDALKIARDLWLDTRAFPGSPEPIPETLANDVRDREPSARIVEPVPKARDHLATSDPRTPP